MDSAARIGREHEDERMKPSGPLRELEDRSYPSAADRVVSMRDWLADRRRFDDLRRLRPWGVGNVVQHPVKVGEGRFDGGQLRIERAWPE